MSDVEPKKPKVAELRDELKSRGLDTKGTKAVLVERLEKAIKAEAGESAGEDSESDPLPVTSAFATEPEFDPLTPVETHSVSNTVSISEKAITESVPSATEVCSSASRTTQEKFEIISLSETKDEAFALSDTYEQEVKAAEEATSKREETWIEQNLAPTEGTSIDDLIENILSKDLAEPQGNIDTSFTGSNLEEVPLLDEEPLLKESNIVKKKSKDSFNINMAAQCDGDALLGNAELNTCPRDPHGINSDCVVAFEDIIGENDVPGRVPNDLWTCNQRTFAICQKWTYFMCSVMAAGPAAVYWGMYYGCITCEHIWCCTPGLRAFRMRLNAYKKIWGACVHCCCDPCAEVFGRK